jgi:iron complex outermembrane receptor protein
MQKLITGCVLFSLTAPLLAQLAQTNLADLELEQLTKVRVTSVSRHSEPLSGAAAAIYVVSEEDIRRQGFTTIADSLRYVPGMQVAQINSHSWAITARGFNNEYANKLLVLMDGRSVYTPLFAGVYWDVQDTILEDLQQIEVIRGPGAALWGANAVNGVINITSKMAQDTQGWFVSGGGGTEERAFGGARYGGKFGAEGFFRVYGSYKNRDDSVYDTGAAGDDDWQIGRGGFRIDWGSLETDLFTLQGDLYAGKESWQFSEAIPAAPFVQTVSDDFNISGANVLGRWTKQLASGSELKIQSYYDHTERESNLPEERRDVVDVDAQHHFELNARNDIVWGLGYRLTSDAIENSYASSFIPTHRSSSLFNIFGQDEITLVVNRLRFTVGARLEHNEFTDFECQPSGRLAWTPTDESTVWTAISRAVRTPSRAEEDIRINRPVPPPAPAGSVASILGNHNSVSETLIAYELGYRSLLTSRLSYDVVAFYHDYDELRSLEPGAPPADPPVPVATFYTDNKLKGAAWGLELASDWQMLDWWRWRGAYTFYELSLEPTAGSADFTTVALLEGNAPRHQFSLRSQMDLTEKIDFDIGLRFVDELENPHVSSYTTIDARIAWRPRPNLELSLVGLNLIEPAHQEFAATQVITGQREVQRSVYGKITWRF